VHAGEQERSNLAAPTSIKSPDRVDGDRRDRMNHKTRRAA
jgi:hypothetical protein